MEQEPPFRPFDFGRVSHRGWPLRQRLSRRVLVAVLHTLVRLEVAGLEHLPASGPYLLVANHLHALDPAIGLLLVPRRVTGVAKARWSRPPFGWLLGAMGDLVYVGGQRGSVTALLDVLRSGGVVAILPEGTRSRTASLGRAERGVALLAARSGAPVVPAAAWGQERAAARWRRLRRVPVRVRIGPPLRVPAGGLPDRASQQAFADEVMRTIAAMLPREYRGVYGE